MISELLCAEVRLLKARHRADYWKLTLVNTNYIPRQRLGPGGTLENIGESDYPILKRWSRGDVTGMRFGEVLPREPGPSQIVSTLMWTRVRTPFEITP